MRKIFFIQDVPDRVLIFDWIRAQTDYTKFLSMKPKFEAPPLLVMTISQGLEALATSIHSGIEQYGTFEWRSGEGNSKEYRALSLTYNPNYQEDISEHASSCGTVRNYRGIDTFKAGHSFEVLKHSYYDTYGFRKKTQVAERGSLGTFLSKFKISMIRSRLALIDARYTNSSRPKFWHVDEEVFQCLRINIPIWTSANFRFQIQGQEDLWLESGRAYTFDANQPHRIFSQQTEASTRVHLVLGFSPWFNYDHELDAYVPNEFYGELHPYDMIRYGYVHPDLKIHE